MIRTDGHDFVIVRTEGGVVNPAAMLQGRSDRFAGRGIPDLRRIIAAGGDHKPSVMAEGGIEDRGRVASQFDFYRSCGKIPDPGHVVLAGSNNARAVGAENGTEHPVRMR